MQQAARVSDKTAFFSLGRLIEQATRRFVHEPQEKHTEDYITICRAFAAVAAASQLFWRLRLMSRNLARFGVAVAIVAGVMLALVLNRARRHTRYAARLAPAGRHRRHWRHLVGER